MLDAFKKSSNRPAALQANELEALIAASKEERAALSTMLTQIQLQIAKLATAGKSLQEVDEKAGKAHARLDEVTDRLAKTGAKVSELEALEGRLTTLAEAIRLAEEDAGRLTAPDGELQRHKQ